MGVRGSVIAFLGFAPVFDNPISRDEPSECWWMTVRSGFYSKGLEP